MIPLTVSGKELLGIRQQIEAVAQAHEPAVSIQIGTMIETPRAALVASELAEHADFFSFGTNDLTQTAMGMSRDDSGSFLPNYTELDIIAANPFASVDRSGVGQLMKIAVKKGKSARRAIKLGICGEHGGDPKSVEFCHQIGLHYVSCSPFRVPTARLAALTGLNQPTVAKVAKRLQSAGLLETRRGATGGYQLLVRPEDISLLHIIEAVEGPIAVNGCVDGTQDPCAASNCCFMSNNWNKVNGALRGALQAVSLADLIDPAELFAPRDTKTHSLSSPQLASGQLAPAN